MFVSVDERDGDNAIGLYWQKSKLCTHIYSNFIFFRSNKSEWNTNLFAYQRPIVTINKKRKSRQLFLSSWLVFLFLIAFFLVLIRMFQGHSRHCKLRSTKKKLATERLNLFLYTPSVHTKRIYWRLMNTKNYLHNESYSIYT